MYPTNSQKTTISIDKYIFLNAIKKFAGSRLIICCWHIVLHTWSVIFLHFNRYCCFSVKSNRIVVTLGDTDFEQSEKLICNLINSKKWWMRLDGLVCYVYGELIQDGYGTNGLYMLVYCYFAKGNLFKVILELVSVCKTRCCNWRGKFSKWTKNDTLVA